MYGSASIRTSAFWDGLGLGGIEGGSLAKGGSEPAILGGRLENKKGLRVQALSRKTGSQRMSRRLVATVCFFGNVSSSTPSLNFALAFWSSISCGSAKRRSTLP